VVCYEEFTGEFIRKRTKRIYSYLFLEIKHKAVLLGKDEKTRLIWMESNLLDISFALREGLRRVTLGNRVD